MGACDFDCDARGKTAREAFRSAVEQAQYDYGHAGYTGTIAEKDQFVEIPVPEGKTANEFVAELMRDNDSRINDKWGPAGCVKVPKEETREGHDDVYLFFGYASS